MMKNNNDSPLIETLIDALRCLPGVGPKSAQRMTYHLLQYKRRPGIHLAETLKQALETVGHCKDCNNFSELSQCSLCADPRRKQTTLCIVAMPSDLLAIEQSRAFNGRYFVLMGQLSPLDGIGPEQLALENLMSLIMDSEVDEVIFALSPTVEGDATVHYISQKLTPLGLTLSRLAQGIPVGSELEFMNGNTIGRALLERSDLPC